MWQNILDTWKRAWKYVWEDDAQQQRDANSESRVHYSNRGKWWQFIYLLALVCISISLICDSHWILLGVAGCALFLIKACVYEGITVSLTLGLQLVPLYYFLYTGFETSRVNLFLAAFISAVMGLFVLGYAVPVGQLDDNWRGKRKEYRKDLSVRAFILDILGVALVLLPEDKSSTWVVLITLFIIEELKIIFRYASIPSSRDSDKRLTTKTALRGATCLLVLQFICGILFAAYSGPHDMPNMLVGILTLLFAIIIGIHIYYKYYKIRQLSLSADDEMKFTESSWDMSFLGFGVELFTLLAYILFLLQKNNSAIPQMDIPDILDIAGTIQSIVLVEQAVYLIGLIHLPERFRNRIDIDSSRIRL
ncbi:hypothetical protein [Bifidobacterium longum]|uniref:hypothetical protein n=1 Tax=Bifidobacterium longum TaxID=216816 RepID=UPI001178CAD9|nr:hypothetical protein [Bifidobacterium longum]